MVYVMSTAAIRSDWAGRIIDGRFTLLQWLGVSESSDVFLTELQKEPSQKAAIKLIPADAGDAEARTASWAAATTLSHPHLMRLFHSGRCQIGNLPLLYEVTEFAEENLSEILPQRPLTPTEATEMLEPVLDALSYLHGKGFVHGHIKPSNIMGVNDRLKLSCDSLQLAGKPGRDLLAPGAYDAPERATGTVSPAADLWSLGVTLVETLTQHPPVWDRSANRDPIVPESIPQPFAGIARECLRTDPEQRCTLGKVKARLDGAQPLRSPAGKSGTAIRAKFRGPAIVAGVLALLVAVAALVLRSHRGEPSPPVAEEQPVSTGAAPTPQSPTPVAVPKTHPSGTGAANSAVVERVLPDVPQRAIETIHGKIKMSIRVTVDSGGNVTDAVLESPGVSKYFSDRALQAARKWKFKPAQTDGQAVPSAWTLEFLFTRTGTEVTPVQVAP